MTVATETFQALTINLEQGDTDLPDCTAMPENEYVGTYYADPPEPLSVATLPATGHEYEMACSRVARQNARVAERAGYRYQRIDRADWEDDLFELRSSEPWRQGRPMTESYMERQTYVSDAWPKPHCKRHLVTVHGVISAGGQLVAYAQVAQCGQVVRFNTILGHAAHLEQRVMWQLGLRLIQWHIDESDARYALYYAHDSGHGDGLRYFKERLGFRPAAVTWLL